jgi:alanyl-tRNA synthetase
MPMTTEKLYYTDSGLLEFSAGITAISNENGLLRVVLDRTAFYPTGGGQPNDTGRLGDAEVVDVREDEAGLITHLVKAPAVFEVGQSVSCAVDAARRLDHMQQHSGQHILSQAFVKGCGAETSSFHLGVKTSTIDIELQAPTIDHMIAAEDIANAVIFDDRPMRVHLVTEEEAARLPLRKDSAVKGLIRVIEVEDFDWSPCGGTHAKRAGQVGLIAIKGFERAKKMTRVEFVCGMRALADYRLANHAATSVGRFFSADRDSGPVLVEKMGQENKALKKRVRELLELALVEEGARLYARASETSSASAPDHKFKVISAVFDDRGPEELRLLAYRIMEHGAAVVLLGSIDGDAARLVFARSPELPQNMGALLAEACQALGGRGGGKPEMAQGGGPNVTKLNEVIAAASQRI